MPNEIYYSVKKNISVPIFSTIVFEQFASFPYLERDNNNMF